MIKIKDVEKSYQSAHVFKRRRTPIVKVCHLSVQSVRRLRLSEKVVAVNRR